MKFVILEALWSQNNDFSVPFCYGWTNGGNTIVVRHFSELVSTISGLLDAKFHVTIYSWNLTRIYEMLLSSPLLLTDCGSNDDGVFVFRIGCIKFCSISALFSKAKQSDITGIEPKDCGIITENTPLKSRGANWVLDYMRKILAKEFNVVQFLIEQYGEDLPYTRAGIIKRSLAKNCQGGTFAMARDSRDYTKLNEYRDKLNSKFEAPDFTNENHYRFMRRVFKNGFVSFNTRYVNRLIKRKIGHRDFCSCYPAAMFSNKFPTKRVDMYRDSSLDVNELVYKLGRWAMFLVYFRDLKSKLPCRPLTKTTSGDPGEENFLVADGDNVKWDGNQLVEADFVAVWITSNELPIFTKFYSYSRCDVVFADVYETDWLPYEYMKVIMDLFSNKCNYKGGPNYIERFFKIGLNSCWGFTTSGFYSEELTLDLYNYNNFKANFEDRCWHYQWGIACTSFAREAILNAIYICGDDWLYTDTDSVFYIWSEELESKLDKYNNILHNSMMNSYFSDKFDFVQYSNYVDKRYELGQLDKEPDLDYFVIYGSKFYIGASESGDFESAASGVSDFDLEGWASEYDSLDSFFKSLNYERQIIPMEYGKLCYIKKHDGMNVDVKDLVGVSHNIDIPSGYIKLSRPAVLSGQYHRIFNEYL